MKIDENSLPPAQIPPKINKTRIVVIYVWNTLTITMGFIGGAFILMESYKSIASRFDLILFIYIVGVSFVLIILFIRGRQGEKNNITLIRIEKYKNFVEFLGVIVFVIALLVPLIIEKFFIGEITYVGYACFFGAICLAIYFTKRKNWPPLMERYKRYSREYYIYGGLPVFRKFNKWVYGVDLTTEKQDKFWLLIVAILFVAGTIWLMIKINLF